MRYSQYLSDKFNKFGLLFDDTELAHKFVPYFESGQRIVVKSPFGETVSGYVGVTSGWKPSFLLLSKVNSRGSSILLSNRWNIEGTRNSWRDGRHLRKGK